MAADARIARAYLLVVLLASFKLRMELGDKSDTTFDTITNVRRLDMIDLQINRSFIAGIDLSGPARAQVRTIDSDSRSDLFRELVAAGTSLKIVGRDGLELASAPLSMEVGALQDVGAQDANARGQTSAFVGQEAIAAQAANVFDSAKWQAQAAGSTIATFDKGVSAAAREAVADTLTLAGLYADAKFDPDSAPDSWFGAYCDVLAHTGWAVSKRLLTNYTATGTQIEVHEAILDLLTAAAIPGSSALVLAKALFTALSKVPGNSPWITLFSEQTRRASISESEYGFVQSDNEGAVLFTDLVSFRITGMTSNQQILFVKMNAASYTFEATVQRVVISLGTLLEMAPAVRQKLRGSGKSFLSGITDL